MKRTVFIIDGFNLYHSVKQAAYQATKTEAGTKWLDLRSLCAANLYQVGHGASLGGVYYFSALAHHMEKSRPGTVARHESYIKCLADSGVVVELSRFKPKDWTCRKCGSNFKRHEEKETDVAVASKLLEVLANSDCESVVLVTGDTDLAPAIRTAKRLYPKCELHFAFPYGRKNEELAQLAPGSFKISGKAYRKHQFSDPYVLSDGTRVAKPAGW